MVEHIKALKYFWCRVRRFLLRDVTFRIGTVRLGPLTSDGIEVSPVGKAARALESAATLAQPTLVDGGNPGSVVVMTNSAGSVNRLTKLGLHSTQSVSMRPSL